MSMQLLEKYKHGILAEEENATLSEEFRSSEFSDLMENINQGKYEEHELNVLEKSIQADYFKLSVSQRRSALCLLRRVNKDSSYALAKQDLDTSFRQFKTASAHLYEVILAIDDSELFIRSIDSRDTEKMYRIAYALINKLEITDGDFKPPLKRVK